MTLSEKLVVLRKLKGITQDEFASAVGVSRQAVYKWESGQSYPEVPKLLEMKLLFGVSIDDLLDDNFVIELPQKKKRRRLSKEAKENIEKSVSSTGSAALGAEALAKASYNETELRAAVAKEAKAEKKVEKKVAAPKAAPAPVAEPVVEAAPAPVAEPVVEAAPAPVAEPVVEAAPAPVAEPVVEAAPAPVAEPVVEAAPAPVAEPVVEAAPAPVAEPVVEAAPAPVAEPAQEEKKEETKKRGFFSRLFGK